MGDVHSTFQNYLFTVEVVSSYVPCSKKSVIICKLEDACLEGYELFGFPSQPTILHLSQSNQRGFGVIGSSQTNANMISQSDLLSQSYLMGDGVPKIGISTDL
jgi:hypothetical protein